MTGIAYEQRAPDETGTYNVLSAIDGECVVPAGWRVTKISALSESPAGTIECAALNEGDPIPVPSTGLTLTPEGNLVAPTITFTDTTAYVVEILR